MFPLIQGVLSGLILSASWYSGLTPLVFAALIPLFLMEDRIGRDPGIRRKMLWTVLYSYAGFIIWNVGVTWWVVYASAGGAVLAFVFNSLFMAMVFGTWSAVRWRLKAKPWTIWLFVPLWIAWEHVHTLWDISWTWLTLGNIFAFRPEWVQWYEYTGTSGGTLWILVANILLYRTFVRWRNASVTARSLVAPVGVIVLPVILSVVIGMSGNTTRFRDGRQLNVLVVQPNIDPYNEKFAFDYQSQFFKALRLARGKVNANTDYIVLPETFITGMSWYGMDESVLGEAEEVRWFRDSLISRFPKLRIVTGGNTYRFYPPGGEQSLTARKDRQSGLYFDVYNTAIYIDDTRALTYHKSKLVPGVEKMPFPALMKPLESLAIDMGGTVGSLGVQEHRDVFADKKQFSVAPVICYESVYADYVTDYIRRGANFIFIVTNDGWWEDTPGYIQHLNYGRLRAIESRRQIARSANTGISCFIDERGGISQPLSWWKEGVIEAKLPSNSGLTFFSRYGDLISRLSLYFSVAMLLAMPVLRVISKRNAKIGLKKNV
jgi:apolipoprotein N-acyltransferase